MAEPAPEILSVLNEWFPIAQAARTEKALSEILVSLILLEARRLVDNNSPDTFMESKSHSGEGYRS